MIAGLYRDRLLPWLTHRAMKDPRFVPYRMRAAGAVQGRVLEVGIGSGLNFRYYGAAATRVVGIDPCKALLRRAARYGEGSAFPLTLVKVTSERLPFEDASFDSVLVTWALCSIANPLGALREVRRVLRPDGRLLFAEHGLAPERWVAAWQRGLTPFWRRLSGGCHLDRPMDELVRSAGFRLQHLATGYAGAPRPLTFQYEGCAIPA
jgi:ubiquinone/menaquinone biosynthesis C-methylase UbiE